MSKKPKSNKLFLNAPKGVTIFRHNIGGDNKEIRFTRAHSERFQKLIGIAHGDKFVWIHPSFSN